MANVSLKTDFKNGEKLYDEQLNNNFKAIVAALKGLNTISWADTPELLTIFRGTEEEVAARPIIDGQLLCDLTNGVMYADFNGKRIFTGGKPGPQGEPGKDGEKGETGESGVYLGNEEPMDPNIKVWIIPDGEPTVESSNLVFNDGETLQEKYDNGDLKGAPGEAGATPVKGVDYFTPEDINSLNIPTITSGTSTPSGGSDGDIYIQYFE